MFKDGGLVSYAFYCPSVVIRVGAGANKYSVTPAADCKAMSGAAQGGNTLTQGAYTVAATNSIVINPTTCKVSGSFVITHAGSSVPVTILNGRLENPIGTLPSKHGQIVAKDSLNQSVVAFTLAR